MKYQEIEGDLITLALEGNFDVIAHGCNCQCVMGAGLAPQMAKAFGCDKFEKEHFMYKGDIEKLGAIDYSYFQDNKNNDLVVINAYTQFMYGTNHLDGVSKPLDYEALTLCLRKINHVFKGRHIGLPLIGCHLAGGIWDYTKLPRTTQEENNIFEKFIQGNKKDVKTIIQEELKDMDVTIVHFNNK
jgi:O-acetyl-ADP-ribose deacetylase (regulator of RNase III)